MDRTYTFHNPSADKLNFPREIVVVQNIKVAQHTHKYPWNPPPPINQPSITYRSHICVSELELSETNPTAMGSIANSNQRPAI